MRLSIFKRLFRIGRANVHAALEEKEDPVRTIDRVLRELDDSAAKVTAAVASQLAVVQRYERELQEAQAVVDRRDRQARLSVANGDEAKAREALIDKRRYMDKCDALRPAHEAAKANADQLQRQLAEMNDKLESMKAQRSTLVAQAEAAKASKLISDAMSGSNDGSLGGSFARMSENVREMQLRAEAAKELANPGQSLDEEFAKLLKDGRGDVEDELAALKSEIGGQKKD